MRLSTTSFCLVVVALYCSQVSAQVQAYLDYDVATGNLALDTVSTTDPLSTFELKSFVHDFLPDAKPQGVLNGLFDVYRADKIFKLEPGGFFDLDFGPVLESDLVPADLANSLCVDGAVLTGGRLHTVELRSGELTLPTNCSFVPPDPDPNPNPNPPPVFPPGQPFFLDFASTTGSLAINSPESAITSIEILSNAALFTGARPASLDGLFDVFVPPKIFKLNPDGFQTLDLENSISQGTSASDLAADLCYSGSVLGGGRVGQLYIRSEDAVHPVVCGAPVPNAVNLDEVIDPNADIGIFVDRDGGNLIVHVPGDPGGAFKPLTRIEISANESLFLPSNELAGSLDGPSDLLTESRLLKVDDDGFGTIDFGPILRPDVPLTDIASMLTVNGVFMDGAMVERVDFVNMAAVPEPSSRLLLMAAGLVLAGCRRFRIVG